MTIDHPTGSIEVVQHGPVLVVRDDLFEGGTKARYVRCLFSGADEVVYASPAQGGAQVALATVARQLGKRATIFVAARKKPHPRVIQAKQQGARVFQVRPGYLAVVEARARDYCKATGASLAPFGFDIPEAEETIASVAVAAAVGHPVNEVWCAYGSGTLLRGLHKAFPEAQFFAVAVGRDPDQRDKDIATIRRYPMPFEWQCKADCPFPSDACYDRKAWQYCAERSTPGRLFWNVAGPPKII